MPYEEARGIVAGQDKIIVAPCICRREHKMMGSGCDRPLEACLVFGPGARYYEENGLGRPIDQQEALDILDQAEKAGLVLQPSNTQKVTNICTCCGCCCQVLINLKKLPEPANHAAANYFATIDPELCIGCGTCIDRCQMEAIEMDEQSATILRKRCIGCGLCVTTCPEEALRLQRKPEAERSTPPPDRMERFRRITQERMTKST
jgi:ferredoxin